MEIINIQSPLEIHPNDLIVITSGLEQQFHINLAEELPADVQVINLTPEILKFTA